MKEFSKMKKNNGGFLLAEAIVVGVFVLTLFTFLFVNVVPLVAKYESDEGYDTINGLYNANLIRTMILKDENYSDIIKLGSAAYKRYDAETFCNLFDSKNYCKTLLNSSYLDVNYVYITWYRTEPIKNSAKNNSYAFERIERDYIEYLDGYKQPAGSTYDSYHRLIVYYNDGTFANIEIKVSE